MKDRTTYRIKVGGVLIDVTKEIYLTYYRMARRAKHLDEKDVLHGVVSYNELDTDELLGQETMPDLNSESVEDMAPCKHFFSNTWLAGRLLIAYYSYRILKPLWNPFSCYKKQTHCFLKKVPDLAEALQVIPGHLSACESPSLPKPDRHAPHPVQNDSALFFQTT